LNFPLGLLVLSNYTLVVANFHGKDLKQYDLKSTSSPI